jgi:Na+-driven multidrug efflux pump
LGLNRIKNKDIWLSYKGFKPNPRVIIAIYKVGVPAICVQAISSLMVIVMNRVLVEFSNTAVAVFGIYYKLQNFIYMPVLGLTQGLIPIIGFNYGAKNGNRVLSAWRFNTIVACGIAVVGSALFLALPEQLFAMFDASPTMAAMGIPTLRIIAVSFIPAAVTIGIGYACSGMGNGVISMISALIRQLVVLTPMVYLLSSLFGLGGIWYAFPAAEMIAVCFAGLSFSRVYKTKIKPIC